MTNSLYPTAAPSPAQPSQASPAQPAAASLYTAPTAKPGAALAPPATGKAAPAKAAPAAPVKAPAPATAAKPTPVASPPVTAATPAPAKPAAPPEPPPVNADDASFAAALYGDPPPDTREQVNWSETAALAADIAPHFTPPPAEDDADGVWDRTETGDAERQALAAAFEHAGAGTTLAKELWGDAVRAYSADYKPTSFEAGTAALKKAWGSKFDKNLAAAKSVIDKAQEKFPNLRQHLIETGLTNDPAFIRKLAAHAARKGKK